MKSFDTWWEKSGQHYEQAVIDAGGTPWALDPEKRRCVAARLGLPDDTAPMDLRRALWARRGNR